MSRPYRHVDTETLKDKHRQWFEVITLHHNQTWTDVARNARVELKRIARELDRRKNGNQYQQ